MQIWQAIVLGAVQGFCEFLPVSSSGHLILAERFLKVNTGGLFFDVVLHIGTLIPVFIVLKKEILSIAKKPRENLRFLVLSSIPAFIVGAVGVTAIENLFYRGDDLSAILISIAFLFTALELFIAQKTTLKRERFYPLSNKIALAMGFGQSLAVIPGLSRSGTVISFGAFCGLEKDKTATFAFLMSVPVILGAAVLSGIKAVTSGAQIEILPLFFGSLTSAITGYIAISTMLKIVKKANYKKFCIYLVIISVVSLISKLAIGV